jgi:hypothetical protein
MMNSDQLQNELLSISHHLDDIRKAVENASLDHATMQEMAASGLDDVEECVSRLSAMLPKQSAKELERMDESIIIKLAREII